MSSSSVKYRQIPPCIQCHAHEAAFDPGAARANLSLIRKFQTEIDHSLLAA